MTFTPAKKFIYINFLPQLKDYHMHPFGPINICNLELFCQIIFDLSYGIQVIKRQYINNIHAV